MNSQTERLDPRIEPLVRGLQKQGLKTVLSCEGHLEKGFGYPWVDTAPEDGDRVLRAVRAFNLRVYRDETEAEVAWVILARGTLRIMPEERDLPLETLQKSAVEFGEFLLEKKGRE